MRSFKIGSVLGIPIKLDATLLLFLPVLTWLIGSRVGVSAEQLNLLFNLQFDAAALSEGVTPYLLGAAAAVGLFVAVLLHELGHSVVAMRYGYPIDSITLWILGGLAQLSDQPEDWKQELAIAIAGPIVSIAIGIVAYVGVLVLPSGFDGVQFVVAYLSLVNFVLAAFNLLPAFPMDGGRVLRALFARNQPYAQATQRAASVGKFFAFLMALAGLFVNIFLVLIAFFIYMGASGESQRTTMNAAFEGVTVGDIMTPEPELDTVTTDTTVAELIERMFHERHTGYPVVENDRLAGLVTLADAQSVQEVERDAYRVGDVMTGVDDLATVSPDDGAMDALDALQASNVGRLPVMADGELVGLISRTDLMTAFNVVTSTGTSAPQAAASLSGPGSSLRRR